MSSPTPAFVLKEATRLVIKLGSSLLLKANTGTDDWLPSVARDVAACCAAGQDVVIVSSGAVALGREYLGLTKSRLSLEESQAAAAAGQRILMDLWSQALAHHNIKVAQILLTLDDTEQRRRYLNARSTITHLLAHNVVPIINENDTVATWEIRYGDNDRMAARVAAMISANCLLLLSNVDGLYSKPPDQQGRRQGTHIGHVPAIDANMLRLAKGASPYGKGGMVTKLDAARIAMQAGCHMVLGDGRVNNPLTALLHSKARATLFEAHIAPQAARKNWIAGGLTPKAGSIVIDAGAAQALLAGKSLLPIGATDIKGEFERGDNVRIVNSDGEELARGLVAWDSTQARKLLGQNSTQIPHLLGVQGREELVHRDDLVIMKPRKEHISDGKA